jgi:hypothetical protein
MLRLLKKERDRVGLLKRERNTRKKKRDMKKEKGKRCIMISCAKKQQRCDLYLWYSKMKKMNKTTFPVHSKEKDKKSVF